MSGVVISTSKSADIDRVQALQREEIGTLYVQLQTTGGQTNRKEMLLLERWSWKGFTHESLFTDVYVSLKRVFVAHSW
jgi:hypothetical protein